jgi:L-lactate dehydrogenase complex protein LldE
MIRHFYPGLLEEDGPTAGRAQVWELSEFIVRVVGVRELGQGLRGTRVGYHHGCHALRELGVRAEPLALLEGAGAEVIPWEAAEECCGFGGLFSIKNPEVSVAMADRKLDTLPEVDVLTSTDGGCLLQLGGRMKRRGVATPLTLLPSLLWAARSGTPAASLDQV